MRLDDVNESALRRVLPTLPATFATKDLSSHPDVVRAHGHHARSRNYHAVVGKYLSSRMADVEYLGKGGSRGALWRNPHAATEAVRPRVRKRLVMPADVRSAPEPRPGAVEIGPQHHGDDPFTRRMRLHQSWYRAHVLGVPCGTGPTSRSTSRYGNMLRPEDGARGLNFLSPEIFEVAQERIAAHRGAVEPFRLLHNMLSSQPLCFNLFAPLARDLDLATRLCRALWGEEVERVTEVRLEWAPADPSQFLDDRTAFDAFIRYRRPDGRLAGVGIEVKLTEPFSPGRYDKPAYRRWMTPDSPWRPDAADRVADPRHNQLWRDHLLAWALAKHPASPYAEVRLAVVMHPEDRRGAEAFEGYRALLRDTRTLERLPLDRIVQRWRGVLGNSPWLDALHLRYLDLQASEGALRSNGPPPAPARATNLADLFAPEGEGEEPEPRPAPPARARATNPADLFAPGGEAPEPWVVGGAVRRGHLRALARLEDADAYRRTRAIYREALGGVEVFLRPTAAGFTVLSLDAARCDSMIGVGGRDTKDHLITDLPPPPEHVARAARGYLAKRDSLRRASAEERFALELVAHALCGDLSLPYPGLYFVTQEWRLPSKGKIDILAVAPDEGRLVVIELKDGPGAAHAYDPKKGGDALEQARGYAAELFERRRELFPFFERLARALARNHGAPAHVADLRLDRDAVPRAVVRWPGGGLE